MSANQKLDSSKSPLKAIVDRRRRRNMAILAGMLDSVGSRDLSIIFRDIGMGRQPVLTDGQRQACVNASSMLGDQ